MNGDELRSRRVDVQARLRSLEHSFDDVVSSIEGVGNDDEHDPDGSTIVIGGIDQADTTSTCASCIRASSSAHRSAA